MKSWPPQRAPGLVPPFNSLVSRRRGAAAALVVAALTATTGVAAQGAAADPHSHHHPAPAPGPSTTPTQGAYAMARESSGTSWQPEATPMDMLHARRGDWSLMLHGFANLVVDRQSGPRGDRKTFSRDDADG